MVINKEKYKNNIDIYIYVKVPVMELSLGANLQSFAMTDFLYFNSWCDKQLLLALV